MKLKTCWEINCAVTKSKIGGAQRLHVVLVMLGLEPKSLVERRTINKDHISLYFNNRHKAQKAFKEIQKLKLNGAEVKIKAMKPADCQKTQKLRKPIAVSKQFVVFPDPRRLDSGCLNRESLVIVTQMAFGTGAHETTCFMSQLIEKCRGKFKTFFDIGTGSGILAILAFKCGAQKIYAMDIDPNCLRAARLNFKVNRVSSSRLIKADIKTFKARRTFDFVAANLITDGLLDNKRKILRFVKKGGYLAVSGIGLDGFLRFREGFRPLPLRCLKVIKGAYWSAILYKRIG